MNDNSPIETQPSSLALKPSSWTLELKQLTDNELLVLFVERQSEPAFNELVTRHSQMVLGVCRSIVSNHACADDAFQATFLALVRNARRLRNAASFSGWLCRVARHAAIKASKAKRSQEWQIDSLEPSIEIDPLNHLAAREVVQSLAQELESIPRRHREAIALYYFESLSRSEIATRMNCTEAIVKGLLHRGKQLLRTRLLRKGIVPSMVVLCMHASGRAAEASSVSVLIAKTTGICAGHLTTANAVPANLLSLSKATAWPTLTANSIALKSVLATSILLAVVAVPLQRPAGLAQAQGGIGVKGGHEIVFEQPIPEPSGTNTFQLHSTPGTTTEVEEDVPAATDDLAKTNKTSDSANEALSAVSPTQSHRIDNRINRRVDDTTSHQPNPLPN